MLKKHLSTLDAAMQRRVLSKWNSIADQAEAMTLSTLRDLEADARRLDRSLDRFLRTAQSRLASPHIGSNAFKLPNRTDWRWRPDVWRVPITPAGAAGFESGTYLDEHTRIFHDCRSSELAFRQTRNSEPGDLAAYAIRLEAFGFDGRFLSIAIELPEACLQTLSKRHILRLDARIDSDRPLTVFARPNLKQGPNTEQTLQAVSPSGSGVRAEFDLAYMNLRDKRIEQAWIDLIFEGPEMTEITVRDVTLSRRRRADI